MRVISPSADCVGTFLIRGRQGLRLFNIVGRGEKVASFVNKLKREQPW